jgi:hypothetical protein
VADLVITLEGQLPSGKNAVKEVFVRGRKIRYPNARFKAWRQAAYQQLRAQRGDWKMLCAPARVQVRYWPGNLLTRDVPGMMDAICHLLEHCPVCRRKNKTCPIPAVQNDGLLHSWIWIRMPLDRERPRAEVTISPEPLPETRRA